MIPAFLGVESWYEGFLCHLCCIADKNTGDSADKYTSGSTSTSVLFTHDVP